MLVEFSVANYRSFENRQIFSLVKGAGRELEGSNCFKIRAPREIELLRTAAVYGPNAGGKSNLLRALKAMRKIIVGADRKALADDLGVTPFLLGSSARDPSEFEAIFINDGVRYQYGFAATKSRIYEEWLFAYPKGRAQTWFHRSWNEESKNYDWDLGQKLHGEKQTWANSTREDALFLSTAVRLNSKQLETVYEWFSKKLKVINIGGISPAFSAECCEDQRKSQVLDFLRSADISIEDIEVSKDTFDPNSLPQDLPEALKTVVVESLEGKEIAEIQTVHKGIDGLKVKFEFEEESDGTQKLFSFAGPWMDSLKNGYVMFIDELHDNLHPKLVEFLVNYFHSDLTNPNNAQLVFTTHETSILNQEVFRRDQIWFCEKESNQASILYPLTDFKPRKGRENLEASYLSGRYGALPYIKQDLPNRAHHEQ